METPDIVGAGMGAIIFVIVFSVVLFAVQVGIFILVIRFAVLSALRKHFPDPQPGAGRVVPFAEPPYRGPTPYGPSHAPEPGMWER